MGKISKNKTLIIVAGPTAVGKTSVSIQLAKEMNCEIISADSRQVYIEMNIGTAKPQYKEFQGVKHHFINNVSIFQNYNVGTYKKEVESFLENYFKNNDKIIVTGGTGLYIEALIEGIDEFPQINKSINEKWNNLYLVKGIEVLQKHLKKIDNEYYLKVDQYNHHRLIRAITVFEQTGIPYSKFLNKNKTKTKYHNINILLERQRTELYERINKRVDIMISNGLIEEAKKLHTNKNLKALNTVGYKELFQYFDGEITIDEAINLIKRNTRRYAKRQLTWFNNRGNWNKFPPGKIDEILSFINKNS